MNSATSSSVEFDQSLRLWFESHNGDTSDALFSTVRRILTALADSFNLREIVDSKEPVLINHLVEHVQANRIEAAMKFSKVIEEIRTKSLSRDSVRMYLSVGRKSLGYMGIAKEMLKPPPLVSSTKNRDENREVLFIPLVLRGLPDDNSVKVFVTKRIETMHKKSATIRSEVTIKNMSRYWTRALAQFGPLETLKIEKGEEMWTVSNVINKISPITTSHELIDLYHLFSVFDDEWKSLTLKQFKALFANERGHHKKQESKTSHKSSFVEEDVDDRDRHRLSSKQQEDIMAACTTPFEKLFISLLFSTGLRVSGVRNIKLADVVADPSADPFVILDFGRTLEKRGKTRTFPLVEMVKKPLIEWVEQNRTLQSPYLFPSPRIAEAPLTVLAFQKAFKAIAKRAGYEGSEVHVHAARHSVAFNLLEAGNTMDQIGKFLGHANPATTAKFYAKMSTRETVARMNTACIGGENRMATHKPDIPDFGRKQREENENVRRRRKKRNYLSALKDIKITIQ